MTGRSWFNAVGEREAVFDGGRRRDIWTSWRTWCGTWSVCTQATCRIPVRGQLL